MKFIKSAPIFFNIMIVYYLAFSINAIISMFRFGYNGVYLIELFVGLLMVSLNLMTRNNLIRLYDEKKKQK